MTQKIIDNNPNILSNYLDKVPKSGERYGKELNDPRLQEEIINAFNKAEQKENESEIGIELNLEDFYIDSPKDLNQKYQNKKLTENGDIRETNFYGIVCQTFTFDAAKREVEKLGKKLLPSATVFQDIWMNKYNGDKEAFIKGENLSVTKLVNDLGFDIGPGFLYVFADGSVFAMFNTDVVKKREENGFFGVYKHNANSNNLKDYLFSIRLAK